MTRLEIIEEIKSLSVSERLEVVQTILASIQQETQKEVQTLSREERNRQMEAAAKLLLDDYLNDPEQTIFTVLDAEDFYD